MKHVSHHGLTEDKSSTQNTEGAGKSIQSVRVAIDPNLDTREQQGVRDPLRG